jgi:hypothetical protein
MIDNRGKQTVGESHGCGFVLVVCRSCWGKDTRLNGAARLRRIHVNMTHVIIAIPARDRRSNSGPGARGGDPGCASDSACTELDYIQSVGLTLRTRSLCAGPQGSPAFYEFSLHGFPWTFRRGLKCLTNS